MIGVLVRSWIGRRDVLVVEMAWCRMTVPRRGFVDAVVAVHVAGECVHQC